MPMQEDSSPCPHGQGLFLTIPEYAIRTGQSKKTVRRKIQQGLLHAVLADGPYGPEYRIRCDGQPPSPKPTTEPTHEARTQTLPMDTDPTHAVSGPSLDGLIALVREQQHTIMELSGRLGFYQAKLQDAEEEIQMLRAPAQPPASEMANHPTHIENGADSGAQQVSARPWWQFWR